MINWRSGVLAGGELMRMRSVPVATAALMIALCGTGEAGAQCSPGSVGFASVGLVAGNPFQAETVTTMTLGEGPSAKTIERPGSVSRDREGRIRSERVMSTYKVKTGDDIGKEVESKTILICDPVAQTLTQLDPLSKTAKVQLQGGATKTNTRNQSQNYCTALFVFEDLEDLGHRTIEGFDAEGRRRIEERERGVDAGGREIPEKIHDQWCAPELQAVILQISQDVAREVTEFKNIRTVEPDPSLFKIPQDYTILEKTTSPSPKIPIPG
jgi:hypothetical protein